MSGSGSATGGVSSSGSVTTDQSASGTVKSDDHSVSGGVKSDESASGSTKTNESTSGTLKSDESASGTLKSDESPSASPSMGNDTGTSNQDDRERMKQQEQIDKKTGLDRADQAAGPYGAEGRDNARTRGNRY
jgi:hypothetical protein